MNRTAIKRLERFLTQATEEAIKGGYTIVAGTYNPTETSCDPMFAACRKEKEAARKSLSTHIPQYEEIVAEQIGHRFLFSDLKSYQMGFDTDYAFDEPIFVQQHYVLDRDVFEMARRLRRKYITKQTSYGLFNQLEQMTDRAWEWLNDHASL